jgi:hypothetical protein
MEKQENIQHLEDPSSEKKHIEEPPSDENASIDVDDVKRNKLLNRRLDYRVLPLCCWVYLLNFLDRGN